MIKWLISLVLITAVSVPLEKCEERQPANRKTDRNAGSPVPMQLVTRSSDEGYKISCFLYDRYGRSTQIVKVDREPTKERTIRLLAVESDQRIVCFAEHVDDEVVLECEILGPARADWGIKDIHGGVVRCEANIASRFGR